MVLSKIVTAPIKIALVVPPKYCFFQTAKSQTVTFLQFDAIVSSTANFNELCIDHQICYKYTQLNLTLLE